MSPNQLIVRDKVGKLQATTSLRNSCAKVIRILMLGALLIAIVAAVDYFFVVPTWGRILAAIGVVFTVLVRARRQTPAYDLSDAAAAVESQHPEYGQRIRTTLDYNTSDAPTASAAPGFIESLTRETEQQAQGQDFQTAVDRRPLRVAICGMAALCGLLLLAALCEPVLWISAGRVFLLPMHYTELQVTPIDKPIPTGADATILAAIAGRPVDSAVLHYKLDSSDQWQSMPLEPSEPTSGDAVTEPVDDAAITSSPQDGIIGDVVATLTDCKESFSYRVTAGPRESLTYRVDVLAPLELQELTAHVMPPAYTKLAAEQTESLDLNVVEGTEVDFQLQLNRAPAEAQLVPVDSSPGETTTLAIEEATVLGRFASLSESQHFVIRAKAADGIAYETERFRIRVRPDGKPRIRFVKPPEDFEVIPTAEVALTVDASDDFGIKRVGISAQVADGPMETLWEQDYPQDESARSEMRAGPLLYLEEHQLTHHDAVTYFAYVIDNRPGKGARTSTELQFIDIRPFKREVQLLNGGGT